MASRGCCLRDGFIREMIYDKKKIDLGLRKESRMKTSTMETHSEMHLTAHEPHPPHPPPSGTLTYV